MGYYQIVTSELEMGDREVKATCVSRENLPQDCRCVPYACRLAMAINTAPTR